MLISLSPRRRLEHLVQTSAKFLSELKLVFGEAFFLMQEPTEKPPLQDLLLYVLHNVGFTEV